MSPYHHHHSTMRERFARLPLPDKLAVGTLAFGGILRLILAWAGRAVVDPDALAAGLAARRIAHGTGFFLLGNAPGHMGPLEPAVGGMLHMLLGESGFVTGLAPALFAFAALWALWRWGKEAAGQWGGLLALLLLVFGPPGAFALQALPMGGWMAALALECLVMAQASRMAYDIRDEWEPTPNAYAGLGLMGGFALWTTRLTVPALLVACWMLSRAMKGRWKKHWKGILATTAGFLPGLAAWLYGLARHGWHLAPSVGGPRGFAACTSAFLHVGGGRTGGAMMVLLLFLAVMGFCIVVAAAIRHRHHHHPARSAAAALAIVHPLWLAATGAARDPTGRPWILWLPAAAILAAVACDAPKSRRVRRCATAVLLACAAWQAVAGIATLAATASASSRRATEWDAIADALACENAIALIAPARDCGLNLRLRETVAVTDGAPASDPAILRKAELAAAPVWSGDYPGISDWLRATGARVHTFEVAGRTFHADPQAPVPPLREWPAPPRHILAAHPSTPAAMLADGHLDSWLEGQGGTLTIEWTFPGPDPVAPAALRLLFDDRGRPDRFVPPGTVRVEILRDGDWETLDLPMPDLETSLGRPYPPSALRFREIPLLPPHRPADALRLTLSDAPGVHDGLLPWRLAEAALFVETDGSDCLDALLGDATFDALRDRLAALPSETTVFAPRRLAGRLAASAALLPAQLPTQSDATNAVPGLIPDARSSCLCVETRHVDAALIALGAADRPAENEICGPWTLFLLPPADPDNRLPGLRLRWAGDLPVADLDFRAIDRLSDIILGKLEGQKTRRNEWLRAQLETPADASPLPGTGTPNAPTVRWREEAVADDPEAPPAAVAAVPDTLALDPKEERKILRFIRQLSLVRPQSLAVLPEEIIYQTGGNELLALRARSGVRPAHPTDTVFRDGLVLQGIDAAPDGNRLALTLYWQASGTARPVPDTTKLSLCTPDGTPVASTAWTGPANAANTPDFGIPLLECQTETIHLDLPSVLSSDTPLHVRISRTRDGIPLPVKSTRGTLLPDASAAILPLR